MRRTTQPETLLLAIALCLTAGNAFADGKVRVQMAVPIPMRDGVTLIGDIFLPEQPGKYPTILDITPYERTELGTSKAYQYWVDHGYAFVVVDDRGRGDSSGEFDWFYPDINDGYDTVEWIASQPWSSGKIGMTGSSYTGTNQWYAAKNKPPHLSCLNPNATAGWFNHELPYQGGAFRLEWNINWVNQTSEHLNQLPLLVDWQEMLKHRPLATLDEAAGRKLILYQKFISHPTYDDFWKRIQLTPADYRKLDIPTLAFTGWFDGTLPGTVFHYENMKQYSPAASQQYIVIGPWVHANAAGGGHDRYGTDAQVARDQPPSVVTGQSARRPPAPQPKVLRVGDLEFPENAFLPGVEITRSFFDWCLKDGPKFQQAAARVYLTGSNRWLDLPSWPPPQMKIQPMYLHSGGNANTFKGDGKLSFFAPQTESPDRYIYDPMNPVPSNIPGKQPPPGNPINTTYVESRADVLVYTSDSFGKPLTIAGDVQLVLQAASDARDTDFTANICDVYPDGRVIKLGPKAGGGVRARFRNGYEQEQLLTPNHPAEFRIDLFEIGHTFLAGHRLRLEVSSSLYPWLSANPNTGNPIATDTDAPRPAMQTIYHNAARASLLLLPVLPGSNALATAGR